MKKAKTVKKVEVKDADIKMSVLTVAQAEKLMQKGKKVHTFQIMGPMMLGCDVDRKELLARFEKFGVELAGPNMTNMHHGLAYFDTKNGWIFVETKKNK